MNHTAMARGAVLLAAASMAMLVSACATHEAQDFRGRWRPVNRFSDEPQAIPLQQTYVYHASPIDGTLKTMLSRWAKDNQMSLDYLHPNDYTLHTPVAKIRTSNLEEAVVTLESAYAEYGVRIKIERSRLVVSQVLNENKSDTAREKE